MNMGLLPQEFNAVSWRSVLLSQVRWRLLFRGTVSYRARSPVKEFLATIFPRVLGRSNVVFTWVALPVVMFSAGSKTTWATLDPAR